MRLCEKAASFSRSLVQDGRLSDKDVSVLSTAFAPLVSTMGIGQVQYRETLSSCICEFARVQPKACTLGLKSAAEERLQQLTSKKEEADDSEQANLQEFLQLLSA